ncbi:helix-turn-helix transcriptional regulator [Pedobacter sp. SD-b]|uniref:Helix-turn-helix transcriptional regulator n=1 Tax=Pedobacter segetis TaxID=2793069 RepID=A0ABS1BFE9_9SPHI|nr:AraC family transcriptional regulator [Pedobacter segetis]MBK0381588.1 helix-turn-helix transcriptional regulator [Pedobacter segetis]
MNEIFVKSLPLKDVIANIAEALDTTYFNRCNEYILNIPEIYGEGSIRGINFLNGFGLIEYNCTLKEALKIHFNVNSIHPLKFIYCSKGSVKHKFEEHDVLHQIEQFQNIIVASTQQNGHILIFPKNENIHLNSLEISRKEFKTKIDCDLNILDVGLKKLFKDLTARNLFFYQGNYSLAMSDCIDTIKTSKFSGIARSLFLEGKSNEILSIQISDYEDDKKDIPKRQILRKSELVQIQKAVQILKSELSKPLTIKELANKVGTNPTKLQEGFRYNFGLTVNNYLNKIRLDYAKEQIMIGELNISEIANNIGIANKSYFSRLFKATFQLNPKEFSLQIAKNANKRQRNRPLT